jgi:hypothetical protein
MIDLSSSSLFLFSETFVVRKLFYFGREKRPLGGWSKRKELIFSKRQNLSVLSNQSRNKLVFQNFILFALIAIIIITQFCLITAFKIKINLFKKLKNIFRFY